jgi:SAM-dependent methyltransferase
MDLVDQSYWDTAYLKVTLFVVKDSVTKWMDKFITPARGESFEIGCYPARYSSYIGKKGWIISGMDLAPQTKELIPWLHSESIKTNKIVQGDVLEYLKTTSDKYDLVCSFGFIEHFENFLDIIELHTKVVKEGGLVLISTPHFKGPVQKFLHSWLDQQNLSRHYLPSMQPELWKTKLEALGFTVEWAGYFGGFTFWADKEKRSVFKKLVIKALEIISPLLTWLPNSASYSPYCGIVARKISK